MERSILAGHYVDTLKDDGLTFFKASTEVRNRKGFGVRTRGIQLDNFKANPIFLWNHDAFSFDTPDMENVLGRVPRVKKEKGELIIGVEWAEHSRAELAKNLVKGGFLNTVSIGFSYDPDVTSKAKDDAGEFLMLDSTELYEVSLVMVPANQEAKKMAASLLGFDMDLNELSGNVSLPEDTPPSDEADVGALIEGIRNEFATERLKAIRGVLT